MLSIADVGPGGACPVAATAHPEDAGLRPIWITYVKRCSFHFNIKIVLTPFKNITLYVVEAENIVMKTPVNLPLVFVSG